MSKDLPWAGGVRRAKADRNAGYATSVGVTTGPLSSGPARPAPEVSDRERREGVTATVTPLEPKRSDTSRPGGRIPLKPY